MRVGALVAGLFAALLAGPLGAQGERSETPLAPGLSYLRMARPGPVVAHVLKADLREASLRPAVVMAGEQVLGTATLSEIVAQQAPAAVVAGGLNGGHSMARSDPYQGTPIGLLVADGELVCDPWPVQRSALLFGANGQPRIEVLGLRGRVAGADGKVQRLGGLNRRRLPGELVLYSPRFNPATRILDAGQQLVLSGVFVDGARLTAGTTYRGKVEALIDGRVNVEIPADGVVLAGEGPGAAWLQQRKIGETVSFSFEFVPDVGEVRSAVGAGPRLVRDGKVAIEAEQERLTITRTTGRQPRSAIGFNEHHLFLVAVDGRNAEVSVGVDVEELARLLLELGCSQAMELDGGGATTLYARDRVINEPSDGLQRGLANAVLLFTTGQLSEKPLPGPTVSTGGAAPTPRVADPPTAPVTPTPPDPAVVQPLPPVRSTPGQAPGTPGGTRLKVAPESVTCELGAVTTLSVTAESTGAQPLATDLTKLVFEVEPSALGTVDAAGQFTAQKAGQGRILVKLGDASAVVVVRISPAAPTAPPAEPAGPTPVAPAGEPTTILRPDLTEVPRPGTQVPTPVTPQPRTPTAPTAPTAPSTEPPADHPAGPTPGTATPGQGVPREAPVIPEGERRAIDGFENQAHWTFKAYPASVPGEATVVKKNIRIQGEHCLMLQYDFTTLNETRAVYATHNTLIGYPKAVSVYVFGDGQGHWLRGQFRDALGTRYTIDFAEFVNWDHQWRRCTAVIPAGVKGPLLWETIYLVQHRPEAKSAGAIYLDQLEGIY